MDANRKTCHVYTQGANQRFCDRVELRTLPVEPHSVDRRILDPGPQRTPRVVRQTSPYSNRSPSPDPKFHSTTGTASPASSSSPTRLHTNDPISEPIRSARPRIIFSRSQRIGRPSVAHPPVRDETKTAQGSKVAQDSNSDHDSKVAQGSKIQVADDSAASRRISEPLDDIASDTDDGSVSGKIAKPPGEVSRPGRGGYNLRAELKWPAARFDKVKSYIDKLVENQLDCTQPLSKQIMTKVEDVRSQASAKFRFLDDYLDHWAVDDFIRCHLKYRKQALQKIALRENAANAQKEIKEVRQLLAKAEKKAKRGEGE